MAESLLSEALCTLAEAKERLKQPSADTTYDDLVTQLINEATGTIEAYCGRKLKSRAYTDSVHDGTGGGRMDAREFPVTVVTSAKEVYKDGVTPDRTITVTGLVQIEGRRTLYLPEGWPYGTKNVKLTYTAGESGVNLKTLRGAVLELIADAWVRFNTAGGAEALTVSAGGQSVTIGAVSIPRRVESMLRNFRRLT